MAAIAAPLAAPLAGPVGQGLAQGIGAALRYGPALLQLADAFRRQGALDGTVADAPRRERLAELIRDAIRGAELPVAVPPAPGFPGPGGLGPLGPFLPWDAAARALLAALAGVLGTPGPMVPSDVAVSPFDWPELESGGADLDPLVEAYITLKNGPDGFIFALCNRPTLGISAGPDVSEEVLNVGFASRFEFEQALDTGGFIDCGENGRRSNPGILLRVFRPGVEVPETTIWAQSESAPSDGNLRGDWYMSRRVVSVRQGPDLIPPGFGSVLEDGGGAFVPGAGSGKAAITPGLGAPSPAPLVPPFADPEPLVQPLPQPGPQVVPISPDPGQLVGAGVAGRPGSVGLLIPGALVGPAPTLPPLPAYTPRPMPGPTLPEYEPQTEPGRAPTTPTRPTIPGDRPAPTEPRPPLPFPDVPVEPGVTPAPGPGPGPGPAPDPGPDTNPSPSPNPGTNPGIVPQPGPPAIPVENPGIIPVPVTTPAPTTPADQHNPAVGVGPVTGNGPAPTLVSMAQEMGRQEQKLSRILGQVENPTNSPQPGPALGDLLGPLLELLLTADGPGAYAVNSPCNTDPVTGEQLPDLVSEWGPSVGIIGALAKRLDALAELQQFQKDLPQPTCARRRPVGEIVSVNFEEV